MDRPALSRPTKVACFVDVDDGSRFAGIRRKLAIAYAKRSFEG